MSSDTMSRSSSLQNLVKELNSSLKAFQQSPSKFRVLKTIHPGKSTPQPPTTSPSAKESPKTLFILDSSFNPPSIAHRYIVLQALRKPASMPKPHRLLLLFATMNADKAPSAASFDQRLTMMCIFAQDLISDINSQGSGDQLSVSIDVGVTTVPYYTDKTAAIEAEGTDWYPSKPTHIHLVGYDTLTRLFNAKYYSSFNPPFSALNPYFDAGHRFQVTLRPDDEYGDVDSQRAFWQNIADGKMEDQGADREWAEQIELVDPSPETGVSSTKIRKAAGRKDWDEVTRLTTPGIADWVREQQLYKDDDRGAKMA